MVQRLQQFQLLAQPCWGVNHDTRVVKVSLLVCEVYVIVA